VLVGGGMGRTPVIATTIREFLPWNQIMNYLEAVVRVYNRWGRRDNMYKARIKILVKAEGQRYIDEVEAEYRQILDHDGRRRTPFPRPSWTACAPLSCRRRCCVAGRRPTQRSPRSCAPPPRTTSSSAAG
jgi:sulfite reductase beta subunit-like hemoprotein